MELKFTVPLNPVTKKNHSRIVIAHGHPIIMPSKQYKEYEKACEPYMPKLDKPIAYPVNVQAVFYKETRRASDVVNHLQAILDIMVKYKVIADDNRNVVFTLNNSKVLYDKTAPRTEVTLTAIPEDEFEAWK